MVTQSTQKLHLCILHMKKAKHQKAKRLIQDQAANKKLKTKWQVGFGRDIIIGPLSLCTIFKCGSTDQ